MMIALQLFVYAQEKHSAIQDKRLDDAVKSDTGPWWAEYMI